jgi:hypothetical protein
MKDDFYAYIIFTANGNGSYQGHEEEFGWKKDHSGVFACMPESLRADGVLTKTDDTYEDEMDGDWDLVETKWVGALSKGEWEDFREWHDFSLDELTQTMGMITEVGMMWAMAYEEDGMNYNVGGVTPVTYTQTYFCCQDKDIMELAGIEDGNG